LLKRSELPSNEQMLEDLRQLLRRKGRICTPLIHESPHTASVSMYRKRFGTLTEAYRLIGYSPKAFSYTPVERRNQIRSEVLNGLISGITDAGGTVSRVPKRYDALLVNSEVIVAVKFAVSRIWRGGTPVWTLCLHMALHVDIEIIVRLHPSADSGICYYLIVPRLADVQGVYHVKADNIPAFIDAYRTTDLSEVVAALGRSQILQGS